MTAARLDQAIGLIRAGDRASGKEALIELLNDEPENDRAWVWMSATVDDDELRRDCLVEALKYNPKNKAARQMLNKLGVHDADVDSAREAAVYRAQVTAASNRDPQRAPDLDTKLLNYTIRQLAGFKSRDDIAMGLAKTGRFDYNNAHRLLDFVSLHYNNKIIQRRLITTVGYIGGFLFFTALLWGTFQLVDVYFAGSGIAQLLSLGLFAIAALLSFVGGLWYIVAAFSASILWGLGVLFVPFVGLFFLFLRADKAVKPFVLNLCGVVLMLLALWLSGADVAAVLSSALQ